MEAKSKMLDVVITTVVRAVNKIQSVCTLEHDIFRSNTGKGRSFTQDR